MGPPAAAVPDVSGPAAEQQRLRRRSSTLDVRQKLRRGVPPQTVTPPSWVLPSAVTAVPLPSLLRGRRLRHQRQTVRHVVPVTLHQKHEGARGFPQ